MVHVSSLQNPNDKTVREQPRCHWIRGRYRTMTVPILRKLSVSAFGGKYTHDYMVNLVSLSLVLLFYDYDSRSVVVDVA